MYIQFQFRLCIDVLSLCQHKVKARQEKESLKRAARQHKHRAVHSQHAVERLEQQLQETVSATSSEGGYTVHWTVCFSAEL